MVKRLERKKGKERQQGDVRDVGSIPGSGRSPGGGHGNLCQYSCLENLMERGTCWATVNRIADSWTQLSMHACTRMYLYTYIYISIFYVFKKIETEPASL